ASGMVNIMIAINGTSDRDRPEWMIAINGIRTPNESALLLFSKKEILPTLPAVLPTHEPRKPTPRPNHQPALHYSTFCPEIARSHALY
ncbi:MULTISPECIES: hypothetical protein, partial [Acidiphilium]|uniref:hypothetical protein n=1 Tax=Acidiphilium TaxID=522 RepID=UPI001B80502C